MGGDLLLCVGECVEGLVGLFANDLVLDADNCGEEDVILCFGLDAYVQLLDSCGV